MEAVGKIFRSSGVVGGGLAGMLAQVTRDCHGARVSVVSLELR